MLPDTAKNLLFLYRDRSLRRPSGGWLKWMSYLGFCVRKAAPKLP